MCKYIYQRVLIIVWSLTIVIAISGIFIPNFYKYPCKDIRIIQNIETTFDQTVNYQTANKSLGRYVKFSYLDINDIRQIEDDFWRYENTLAKSCSPSYYRLVKDKKYSLIRGWLLWLILGILILTTILLPLSLCDEMDLNRDYQGDEKNIGFFRLNVFNIWHAFCGYPHDILYAYCSMKANEMNDCPSYKYNIPSYKKLKAEFKKFINEQKSEVVVSEN